MYAEPGKYICDFCILQHEGKYHLFHIRGNRGAFSTYTLYNNGSEEDLGHATSSDLVVWQRHEPVVPRGARGSWDEFKVLAPHIVQKDGIYYMFYTGLNCPHPEWKRNHSLERIGLATSQDLFNWEKHPNNPIVTPGDWAMWGEPKPPGNVRMSAGRDSMVFFDNRKNVYIMYYTATMKDGRACIGTATSNNLLDWQDNGPTYIEDDMTYNRCESPYLCQEGDRYYLFYSGKGEREDHWEVCYLISHDPLGEWKKPVNHILLEDWACASEHPKFDGQFYMFLVVYEEVNGRFARGKVSDPILMRFREDGTVQLSEYLAPQPPRKKANLDRFVVLEKDKDPVGVVPIEVTDTMQVEDQLLLSVAGNVNVSFKTKVRIHGQEAGIALRMDERGDSGYFITLVPAEKKIRFYKIIAEGDVEIIQERSLPWIGKDRFYEIKVTAKGEFFEIYLDDDMVIVRANYDSPSGNIGLYAKGVAHFKESELFHLSLRAEHFWGKVEY